MGVIVRRYINFLILLIPTPLVSVLFAAASLLFVHFKNVFRSCIKLKFIYFFPQCSWICEQNKKNIQTIHNYSVNTLQTILWNK